MFKDYWAHKGELHYLFIQKPEILAYELVPELLWNTCFGNPGILKKEKA